ncbi:hypothetical protein JZU54_04505, partial [bacterium]|nr:hypothetical protein [bacterium]
MVFSTQLAFPQTYSSTASGNWGNSSTWLEGSVPVSGNSVGVGGGNTVTYGSSDSYAGAAVGWWNGLGIGIGFGPSVGAGTLNITGGTLDTGGFFVGHDYPGTINLSGGTLNASGQHMLFGWTAGSSLNVSGGTLNITGASGNATMDTLYDFIAPNSSVFNNAGATLTKTGAGKLTFWGLLFIDNGALDMQAGTIEASTGICIGSNGGSASGTLRGGTLKVGYLGAANFAVGLGGGTGTLT